MKEKIIFHGFILIIFLACLQRVISNIIYISNYNLGKGIIYDSKSYKRSINSARTYTYLINDKNGIKYQDSGDSDTKTYGFRIGDTVTFRKLNIYSNNVRMITRNGKKIRNYFGFVDYATLFSLIFIIFSYIFIPKILKNKA
jgi:hypothetical protein